MSLLLPEPALYTVLNGVRGRSTFGLQSTPTRASSEDLVRAELRRKQDAYEADRRARAAQELRSGGGGAGEVPALASLPLQSYLDEEGLLQTIEVGKEVKASIYGVFDADERLRFVGISRNVKQSLRMHLGRQPALTYYFKLHHVTKPSRTLLEHIKESWLAENGAPVEGNDGGAQQKLWENALDTTALMTEEDKAMLAEAKQLSAIKEASAVKRIAKRFEDEKVKVLVGERGCKESMRFCPQLKSKGLLDFFVKKQKKDEVPKSQKPPATTTK